MNKLGSFFLASMFFLLSTQSSWACRCVPFNLEQSYNKSKLAVIATTVKIDNMSNESKKVTLKIHKSWKEKIESQIELIQEPSSCAFIFKKNTKYLLYLNKHNNRFYTTLCSGNKEYNSAKSELKWLNNHSKSKVIN